MPRARTVQHALKYLRDNGYTAEVVERWVPGANRRKDLFGVADIVAFCDTETVLVQVCAASGLAAHKKTIESNLHMLVWCGVQGRHVGIVSVARRKIKRGGKAFKYECKAHTWRPVRGLWEVSGLGRGEV